MRIREELCLNAAVNIHVLYIHGTLQIDSCFQKSGFSLFIGSSSVSLTLTFVWYHMCNRRQRRNKAKLSKTQVQLVSKRLDFKRKDDPDEAVMQARAVAKKNLQQSKKKVLVIKNQATSKYDWTVQHQAGCTFWLHKPTGTISNEMPYCEDEEEDSVCTQSDQESQGGLSASSSPMRGHHHTHSNTPTTHAHASSTFDDNLIQPHDKGSPGQSDLPPATGSLVYDSFEFNNFLNMLNEMQVQEEDIKAAKEAKKKSTGKKKH